MHQTVRNILRTLPYSNPPQNMTQARDIIEAALATAMHEVNGRVVEFNALTYIDTTSNLEDLIRINEKSSVHVTEKFKQVWLARYPLMKCCVHDMVGEFIGGSFQRLLAHLNIKDTQSISKHLQSNSICKRIHQTVCNSLRTLLYSNPPKI